MTDTDPRLDLTLRRDISASRQTIWQAWTDPRLLEPWWVPQPTLARVDRIEVRPGGAFVMSISANGGHFLPHSDGIFNRDRHEELGFFNGWGSVTAALAALAESRAAS